MYCNMTDIETKFRIWKHQIKSNKTTTQTFLKSKVRGILQYYIGIYIVYYKYIFRNIAIPGTRLETKSQSLRWLTNLVPDSQILNLKWQNNPLFWYKSSNQILLQFFSQCEVASAIGLLKEAQIVYRLFPVSWYLLHSFWIMPSQLATWVSDWLNWLELAWQYIAMTRNNLCIISISLGLLSCHSRTLKSALILQSCPNLGGRVFLDRSVNPIKIRRGQSMPTALLLTHPSGFSGLPTALY